MYHFPKQAIDSITFDKKDDDSSDGIKIIVDTIMAIPLVRALREFIISKNPIFQFHFWENRIIIKKKEKFSS